MSRRYDGELRELSPGSLLVFPGPAARYLPFGLHPIADISRGSVGVKSLSPQRRRDFMFRRSRELMTRV